MFIRLPTLATAAFALAFTTSLPARAQDAQDRVIGTIMGRTSSVPPHETADEPIERDRQTSLAAIIATPAGSGHAAARVGVPVDPAQRDLQSVLVASLFGTR